MAMAVHYFVPGIDKWFEKSQEHKESDLKYFKNLSDHIANNGVCYGKHF